MQRRTRRIAIAVAGAVIVVGGAATGYAVTAGDDGDGGDVRLEGEQYRRAADAAVAAVGGVTVTEAEHDDGGTAGYEVEVRLRDGREVEVHLDPGFVVTGTAGDDQDDGGEPEDD